MSGAEICDPIKHLYSHALSFSATNVILALTSFHNSQYCGTSNGAQILKERYSMSEVFPEKSVDEEDIGWGDRESDRDDEIKREKPPHHGS